MKSILLLITTVFIALGSHAGSKDRGGGDLCEARIRNVAADFKAWLIGGGAAGLQLKNLSADAYAVGMRRTIDESKVRCLAAGDAGFPLQIDGTPKVCRFDKSESEKWISCDAEKFSKLSASDHYVLIHHELAGLSGFELPNADQSTYAISNQISGFLSATVERKLFVRKISGQIKTVDDILQLGYIPNIDLKDALEYCASFDAHVPSVREWAEIATSLGAKGIRETRFPNVDVFDPRATGEMEQNAKDGFTEVLYHPTNPDPRVKPTVEFYFNKDGYVDGSFKAHIPSLRAVWLWTDGSSLNDESAEPSGGYPLTFFTQAVPEKPEQRRFPRFMGSNYSTDIYPNVGVVCLAGKK